MKKNKQQLLDELQELQTRMRVCEAETAALRESEEKFHAVLEQFSDGFSLLDEQGRLVEWNRAMERLTGLEREWVIGRTGWEVQWELMPPESRAHWTLPDLEAYVHGLLKSAPRLESKHATEVIFAMADGQVKHARQSISLVKTTSGVKLGLTLHDITAQKVAEVALQESEERYRRLVELSPSAVFVESDGRIVFANQACARLLGAQSIEQILEKSNMDFVPPEFHEFVLDRIQRLALGQDNPPSEEKFLRLDGTAFDVEVSAARMFYRGKPARQIIVQDISERKQAEQTLQQAHGDLKSQIARIEALQDRLREQAIRDYLTGLFNRRYLQLTLERELARAAREKQPVSLVMMDVDHFKRTNDKYGHRAGDKLLETWGRVLKMNIRAEDVACRYGGEEFVIVMPGASLEVAQQRAEWLCAYCADLRLSFEGHELDMTMSMGVASFPQHALDEEGLLIRADRALYRAKRAGRNRVSVFKE
jgi:diguanylate cyclase (GGDEF)-like protein/PAS domain S-box-containing protein